MAIVDILRRTVMAKNRGGYVADRRLYLDKDNNVVEADDPKRVSLLIRQGGTLSEEDALKYGLIDEEGEPVKAQAAKGEASEAEGAEDAGEGDSSEDLESKTKAELSEIAESRGIKVTSSMTKAEMVEAIEAGPQEEESDE